MDISSVNSDLIRGNVTTIILGCLWDTDKYGYEILKEIEDKSNSHYVLKQATLYNQLKRLEKQGLVCRTTETLTTRVAASADTILSQKKVALS